MRFRAGRIADVTGDDFVYLIDFGIAHDATATKLTETGSIVGSLPTWLPSASLEVCLSVIATNPAGPVAPARATLWADPFRKAVRAFHASPMTWSCRRSKPSPMPRTC
jgi:hypothetical protein